MIEDRAWLAERLEAGATVAAIAAEAGVSRQTASSSLRRHGLAANKRPLQRPSADELADAFAVAGTTVALAEQLGVGQSTASRWLREAGHPPLPRMRPRKPLSPAEVRARRGAGETWAQIAEACGVGVETARRRAAEGTDQAQPAGDTPV